MKKLLLILISVLSFSSCNPEEELFKQENTITFKMPASPKVALARVENIFNTVINTDTLTNNDNRPNKNEYLWDEMDDNGNQVAEEVYRIFITVNGTEIANGAYVVGH